MRMRKSYSKSESLAINSLYLEKKSALLFQQVSRMIFFLIRTHVPLSNLLYPISHLGPLGRNRGRALAKKHPTEHSEWRNTVWDQMVERRKEQPGTGRERRPSQPPTTSLLSPSLGQG